MFHGVDLLDLARPGSGLTLRRLALLIRALPPEAAIWAAMSTAQAKALKPTPEQIRERQKHYDRKREASA